jgi:RNA polymerase sigma-70 factor (ECF subfamily)
MTPQERDLGLLLRLQARDATALEALYDAYGVLLYTVALRIVRDAADAEEVVQDSWVQVWRGAATYDSRRATVAGWLTTVVRSRALDRYRSKASRQRAETGAETALAPPPAAPTPESESVHSQLAARLGGALARLPAEHRRVLELAYFRGLSQSQIAAELDKPLGTIKSWARQGLLRLRELVPQEQWL